MTNAYFNKQVNPDPKKGGKGLGGTGFLADTAAQDRIDKAPRAFKEKPGFSGRPNFGGFKKQPTDRSGGVKRAKVRPDEEGL